MVLLSTVVAVGEVTVIVSSAHAMQDKDNHSKGHITKQGRQAWTAKATGPDN
jgi:hypothetical protein